MKAISDLQTLLSEMRPEKGKCFAFCQLAKEVFETLSVPVLATFWEKEGVTALIERELALKEGIPFCYAGVQITLTVNSSLEAVGFLAAITRALAENGISVNTFSPVSHDHLFVKEEDAERAMILLHDLSRRGQ